MDKIKNIRERFSLYLQQVRTSSHYNTWKKLTPFLILTLALIPAVTLVLRQQTLQQHASDPGVHDAKVLVLEYFPQDPAKSGYLDPQEMGGVVETQDLISRPISYWESKVQNMIDGQIAFINEASKFHGYKNPSTPAALTFEVVDKKEFLTPIPKGYRASNSSGPFLPNYGQIMKDINICNYVNQGVKEIWMFGYHTSQIVPDESRMISHYGTVSNTPVTEESAGYAPFRAPQCTYSYTIYNYTYQRDLPQMIHNRIHQFENMMPFAEGQWPATPANRLVSLFWSNFGKWEGPSNSCGNSHFPPNLVSHDEEYKYDLSRSLPSNCETWNPDPSLSTSVQTSCSVWGCTELGYYKWWLQNIPGLHNGIWYQGKKMRNWWEAMSDFDSFINKGKSLFCVPTSASEPDCSDTQAPSPTTTYISPSPTVKPTNPPTPTPTLRQVLSPTPSPIASVIYTVSLSLAPSGPHTDNAKQVVICFYEYDPVIEPGNDFACERAKVKKIATVNFDGAAYSNTHILLENLTTQRYIITVKYVGGIPQKMPFPVDVVPNGGIDFAVLLRTGDLNHDGHVDSQDVQFLISNCYGKKAETSLCQKNEADFNDDKVIDGIDYSILLNAVSRPN